MVRPKKYRFVSVEPEVLYFKPRGVPLVDLKEIVLNFEELEAVRLKDFKGLEQEECAENMKISRTTFHRIYGNAKKKIADFLLNGKALKIEGGSCIINARMFMCIKCKNEWQQTYGKGRPEKCPTCGSFHIQSKYKILNKNKRR